MKRILCGLLVVALAFALCACGNSSKRDFVGVWEGEDAFGTPTTITINDNGTGNVNGEEWKEAFTWKIKGENTIVVDYGDDTDIATINKDATPFELTWEFIETPFVKSSD